MLSTYFLNLEFFLPIEIRVQSLFFTAMKLYKPWLSYNFIYILIILFRNITFFALVAKSANLMPSGTILKTVQKSNIYIFGNK